MKQKKTSFTKSLLVLVLTLSVLFTGLPLMVGAEGTEGSPEPGITNGDGGGTTGDPVLDDLIDGPTDGGNGGPMAPVNPTDPVDPANPADPADPVDPADPAEPTDPDLETDGDEEGLEEVDTEDDELDAEVDQSPATDRELALFAPQLVAQDREDNEVQSFYTGMANAIPVKIRASHSLEVIEGENGKHINRLLKNVAVKVTVDGPYKDKINFGGADGSKFTVTTGENGKDYVIITRPEYEGDGSSQGVFTFGEFVVWWDNETTATSKFTDNKDALLATLKIDYITADGSSQVDVNNDEAKGAGWGSNKLTVDLLPLAENHWNFVAMKNAADGKTTGSNAFEREKKDDFVGKKYLSVDDDGDGNKVTYNLGVKADVYGGVNGEGYIKANSVTFAVELAYGTDLGFSFEGISADALSTGVPYGDAFKSHFELGGYDADKWNVTVKSIGNNTLRLTFESIGNVVYDEPILAVNPTITFTGFSFPNGITNDAFESSVGISYNFKDEGVSFIKAEVDYVNAIGQAGGATHTVTIPYVQSTKEIVDKLLDNIGKSPVPWKYNLNGHEEGSFQDGSVGDTTRQFVADGSLVLDGGKTIEWDKYWFTFTKLEGITLPAGVTEFSLQDKPADTNMQIVGFTQLTVDKGIVTYSVGGSTPVAWEELTDRHGLDTTTHEGVAYMPRNDDGSFSDTLSSVEYVVVPDSEEPDVAMKIGKAPSLMFAVAKGVSVADLIGKKVEHYTNDAVATIRYMGENDAGKPEELKAVNDKLQAIVPYLDVDAKLGGKKNYANLTRAGREGSLEGAKNMPGDKIEYTVTIEVPKQDNGLNWVDGIAILDSPRQNVTIVPEDMDVRVSISGNGGGTGNNGNTVGKGDGVLVNPATGNDNKGNYTGVTPFTTANIAASGYGWLADAMVKKDNAPMNENDHLYLFKGRFVAGAKITIKYYAYISNPLDENASSNAINDVYYKGWVNGLPGTGGSGTWSWSGDTSCTIPIGKLLRYGDVWIDAFSAKSGTLCDTFLPDDAAYLEVLGGAVNTGEPINNPVFLVKLADVFELTGPVGDIYKYIMSMAENGANTNREWIAANGDIVGGNVTYLDKGGSSTNDYADVRYIMVEPNVTALNTERTVGSAPLSDIIFFNIPVKARSVDTKETTIKSNNQVVLASAEAIYLNALGTGKSMWTNTGSAGVTLGNTQDGGSLTKNKNIAGITPVVIDNALVNVYQLPREVNIQKTAGSTIEGQSDNLVELHFGESIYYNITVTNKPLAGIDEINNSPKDLEIPYIVDLMVPDQVMTGIAVTSSNGTPLDFSASSSEVTVNVDGRSLLAQRIVITLNGDSRKLAYGKSINVVIQAEMKNDTMLFNKVYYRDWYNTASAYFKTEDARPTDAKRAEQYNPGDAQWAIGGVANETYTRIWDTAPVRHRGSRIAPGIQKTLTEPKVENNSLVNGYGVDMVWTVQVKNHDGAEMSMTRYTVVDVLPLGLKYEGVGEGTLEPDGHYTNGSGQDVVYWLYNAEDPGREGEALKPGATLTYKLKTYAKEGITGHFINTAYLIPSGDAGHYFDSMSLEEGWGTMVPAADPTMNELLKKAGGEGDPVTLDTALVSRATIELRNDYGAYAYKTVSTSNKKDNNTSSYTPYKHVVTSRGEVATYTFEVKNDSDKKNSKTYTDLVVYDTLPAENDKYVYMGSSRQSKWAPQLFFGNQQPGSTIFTAHICDMNAADYNSGKSYPVTVEYSDTAYTTVEGNKTGSWSATWNSNDNPAAVKLTIGGGAQLKTGEKLVVVWQMKVPDDLSSSSVNRIAYNSAALTFKVGSLNFSTEPEKVGLLLQSDPDLELEVDKVLSGSVSSDTFTFQLYKWEAIEANDSGSWVPYGFAENNLKYDASIVPIESGEVGDATTGMFQITAKNNGKKFGGIISNMTEGTYKIEEINIKAVYTKVRYQSTSAVGGTQAEQQTAIVARGLNTPSVTVYNSTSSAPTPPTTPTTDPTPPPTPPAPPAPPAGPGPGTPADPGTPTVAPVVPGGLNASDIVLNDAAPLAGLEGAHWSLLNLMCALFCGITSIIMMVMMIFRRIRTKSDEEEEAEVLEADSDAEIGELEEEQAARRKQGYLWRVLSVVVFIGAAIGFLLNEDIREPMVFVCEWTPLQVTFAIAQVLVMLGLRQTLRKPDEDEFEDDDLTPSEA